MLCDVLRYDIWPRPLGEHAWFSVPVIGELMYSIGAVDGTRRNCDPGDEVGLVRINATDIYMGMGQYL